MMLASFIFWFSLIIIVYSYCIYPLILMLLVRAKRPPQQPVSNGFEPRVSVLISAYNEESILKEKLLNLESIDYPADKIEFLFGSDGSTDLTNEILQKSRLRNLKVCVFSDRRGKALVLNELIQQAEGEVVVFSDANTIYRPETVRKLVQHFSHPETGAVCGELVLTAETGFAGNIGESLYWLYENYLKRLESDIHTMLGATGGVYAIRKQLYTPLPTTKAVTDDFLISTMIIKSGYRVRYEPTALAYEKGLGSVLGEFQRKVRIGASNFNGIAEFRPLLHPRKGFVAMALWSRKIIRWCVPFLLLAMFLSTVALSFGSEFFRLLLWIELIFLFAVFVGFVLDKLNVKIGIFGLPFYFAAMNAALFVGFLHFWRGKQRPTWEVIR
ncbi:MAG: glycosyltransferase family 2 protein [Ignavibacteriales bacterium]|nr:glycosyltransferase family 2 protein [Ignavibacteriales bacterium]